jgi:catechol 2,3-dioxygenase-like lactoylglutathione lyase family enzyme
MDQNVHFITFATPNLDAARDFYVTALGWTPLLDVPEEIVFFQIAPGMVLGLFDVDKFQRDLPTGDPHPAVSGVTLAHNVGSPDEVRTNVEAMLSAGGELLTPAQEGDFGGIFHAHVRDPNGIVWEIAHNPGWSVSPRGDVSFG